MGLIARPLAGLGLGRRASGQDQARAATPEPFVALPFVAIAGLAVSVAIVVASVPIGSGDYGQWLMVSRQFVGESTPAYRDLSQSAPGVPILIALAGLVVRDPMTALHAVGFAIVVALAAVFFLAGWAFDGRRLTGVLAAAAGLLVTDQLLDLIAFGGLPQAAGIVGSVGAMAAFAWAGRAPRHERAAWIVGCVALLGACLGHVATATVAMPACLAVAALGVVPRLRLAPPGAIRNADPARNLRAVAAWLRWTWPLAVGFALVGGYWLAFVVPASQGLVTNPASLSYRGPERVVDLLSSYPPTLVVIVLGFARLAGWAVGLVRRRRLPAGRDPWLVMTVWTAASWGAYAWSAATSTSTDYPRFGPILVAPLVVAAAAAVAEIAVRLARAIRFRPTIERGVVALAVAIVVVAPFSLARFEESAQGYELPDAASLQAAAAWADGKLVPGASILASVREGKWIEGLTGRAALFSSAVRYSFRPDEWQRSLVARAILQGDVAIANEAFVATLGDDVVAPTGVQPRGLLITANHGGEDVDLLRLVTTSSGVFDAANQPIARMSSLTPAGFGQSVGSQSISASMAWTAARRGSTVHVDEALSLASGSTTMTFEVDVATPLSGTTVQLDLHPASAPILGISQTSGNAVVLTFPQMGRTQPQLRLALDRAGTIVADGSGGVLLSAPGSHLGLEVTDLTAGGATSPLQLLDSTQLVDQYQVGAVILFHDDVAYADREKRLELLGFRPVDAEGPYVVLIRSDAVQRAVAP